MKPPTPSISIAAEPGANGKRAVLAPLPDHLRRGLKLVFVGFNPGERSARLRHYYAGIGNMFWPALHQSGLVPKRLNFVDDHRLPAFGIGLTDLVKRPSRSASDLRRREFRDGRTVLLRKLRRVRPAVVAFNGKGVYEILCGKPCSLGRQAELLCGAHVFVLPSTSARNATISRAEKLQWFRRLKKAIVALADPNEI